MNTTNIHYDEKLIVELYNSGISQKNIADSMGTYNTTIRRILKRNNIRIRPQTEVRSTISANPFIGDATSNYFLGYIAADGNIASKSWKTFKYAINLSTCKDPHILYKFKSFVKSANKVRSKTHKKFKTPEYSYTFSHKETWEYMNKIGLTGNKSKTLKMSIPLTRDFIRGVLDGDGTITIQNKRALHGGYATASITTASCEFSKQLLKTLKRFKPTVNYYNGVYTVAIYKIKYVEKFYHYLYDDATIFLERKEEKFRLNLRET